MAHHQPSFLGFWSLAKCIWIALMQVINATLSPSLHQILVVTKVPCDHNGQATSSTMRVGRVTMLSIPDQPNLPSVRNWKARSNISSEVKHGCWIAIIIIISLSSSCLCFSVYSFYCIKLVVKTLYKNKSQCTLAQNYILGNCQENVCYLHRFISTSKQIKVLAL